jgi:hypothetical protein
MSRYTFKYANKALAEMQACINTDECSRVTGCMREYYPELAMHTAELTEYARTKKAKKALEYLNLWEINETGIVSEAIKMANLDTRSLIQVVDMTRALHIVSSHGNNNETKFIINQLKSRLEDPEVQAAVRAALARVEQFSQTRFGGICEALSRAKRDTAEEKAAKQAEEAAIAAKQAEEAAIAAIEAEIAAKNAELANAQFVMHELSQMVVSMQQQLAATTLYTTQLESIVYSSMQAPQEPASIDANTMFNGMFNGMM